MTDKTFKEVLLEIGNIVLVVEEDGKSANKYLIIGKRQYNPNSGKSWDYAGVPLEEGYRMENKKEHPYEWSNMYFFNHTDIVEIKEFEEGEKI